MKCYSIAELHLTDRAWIAEYVTNVTKLAGVRTELVMVPEEGVTGTAWMS